MILDKIATRQPVLRPHNLFIWEYRGNTTIGRGLPFRSNHRIEMESKPSFFSASSLLALKFTTTPHHFLTRLLFLGCAEKLSFQIFYNAILHNFKLIIIWNSHLWPCSILFFFNYLSCIRFFVSILRCQIFSRFGLIIRYDLPFDLPSPPKELNAKESYTRYEVVLAFFLSFLPTKNGKNVFKNVHSVAAARLI